MPDLDKEKQQTILVLTLKYGSISKAFRYWIDGLGDYGMTGNPRNAEFNADELAIFQSFIHAFNESEEKFNPKKSTE